jgi:hypothetical protein
MHEPLKDSDLGSRTLGWEGISQVFAPLYEPLNDSDWAAAARISSALHRQERAQFGQLPLLQWLGHNQVHYCPGQISTRSDGHCSQIDPQQLGPFL